MESDLMLDVSQAAEIKFAARRTGATNRDLKVLSEGDNLWKILPVLRGVGKVVIDKVISNLDFHTPDKWTSRTAKNVSELFTFDPLRIGLYLDEDQNRGIIYGPELRQRLWGNSKLSLIGPSLLDFYLMNEYFIPSEWIGLTICSWGAEFIDPDGSVFIRCMFFNDVNKVWSAYYHRVDPDVRFSKKFHAAILI